MALPKKQRQRSTLPLIMLIQRRRRNNYGQGIVMGVLVVSLLVGIIVGGCVFLVSVGTATYYQQRFNNIANAAAKFAVNSDYWLGAVRPDIDTSKTASSTQSITVLMLQQLGVSISKTDVQVDQNATALINEVPTPGCAVTITLSELPIIQGILTGNLSLSAHGFEPWLDQAPVGVDQISTNNGSTGFYVPTYGLDSKTGPAYLPDGFVCLPYWENGAYNGRKTTVLGPYQNKPNAPWSGY